MPEFLTQETKPVEISLPEAEKKPTLAAHFERLMPLEMFTAKDKT